jgi:hypothetical protein
VGSSAFIPHVIEENGVVVLTGRGEPKVRVLEIQGTSRGEVSKTTPGTTDETPDFGRIHTCSDYVFETSVVTQPHSFAVLPRRVCATAKAEWARMAVLTDNAVVPVSLTLPRANDLKEYFSDDLFPETNAGLAVGDAHSWYKQSHGSMILSVASDKNPERYGC